MEYTESKGEVNINLNTRKGMPMEEPTQITNEQFYDLLLYLKRRLKEGDRDVTKFMEDIRDLPSEAKKPVGQYGFECQIGGPTIDLSIRCRDKFIKLVIDLGTSIKAKLNGKYKGKAE